MGCTPWVSTAGHAAGSRAGRARVHGLGHRPRWCVPLSQRAARPDRQTVLDSGCPRPGQKNARDVLDIVARIRRRPVSSRPSSAAASSPTIRRRAWSREAPTPSRARTATSPRCARDHSPEFWSQASPRPGQTPHEYVVSALRAVGAEVTGARASCGRDNLAAMACSRQALDPTGWSDSGRTGSPTPARPAPRELRARARQPDDRWRGRGLRGLLARRRSSSPPAVTAR